MNPSRSCRLLLLLLSVTLPASLPAAIVINEIDPNDRGPDDAEFVELHGNAGESLDNHKLAFFYGGDDLVYRVIDLSGFSIPADGFFVVGTPAVPNVDLAVPVPAPLPVDNGGLMTPSASRPDAGAIALYNGVIDVGNAVTTTNLVDAIVYDVSRLDDAELLALLLPGQPQIDEAAQLAHVDQSIGRPAAGGTARNTSLHATMRPTPGQSNAGQGGLTDHVEIVIANKVLTEADAAQNATVQLKDSTGVPLNAAADLTVQLRNTDPSELSLSAASVVIPAGQNTSAAFTVSPVNDTWMDGTQVAYVQATAPGVCGVSEVFSVSDNGDPAAGLVINEVNSLTSTTGDANGNGSTGTDDEFVEIVNTGGAEVNLSGKVLRAGSAEQFIFPPGSILRPGRAVVVFGAGVTSGIGLNLNRFGDALVLAGTGALGIDDSYDVIRLMDGATELADLVFNPVGPGSVARAPDLTGTHGGVKNAAVTQVDAAVTGSVHALLAGSRLSPGTKLNGDAFGTNELLLGFASGCLAEAGDAESILTITRVGPQVGVLIVNLSGAPAGFASLSAPSVSLANGEASRTINLGPLRNPQTTDQVVTVTGTAGSYQNQTAPLTLVSLDSTSNPGLTISSSAAAVVESAGAGAATITIARSGSTVAELPLTVELRENSVLPYTRDVDGDATLSGAGVTPVSPGIYNVSIPAGQASVSLSLDPANDDDGVDNDILEIAALADAANGCLNDVHPITLTNRGAVAKGPFINEVDAANGGADDFEYVELLVPGHANLALGAYTIVVMDASGANGGRIFALTGLTTDASGYFVIGDLGVRSLASAEEGAGFSLLAGFDMPDSGAVAIYKDFNANGGRLDNLLDAVVYGTDVAALADELLRSGDELAEGAELKSIGRNPEPTAATDTAALRNTSGEFGTQLPTPGLSNTAIQAPFDAWMAMNMACTPDTCVNPTPANLAPGGDRDGDAVPNLTEYGLGSPPNTPAFILPQLSADGRTFTATKSARAQLDPHLRFVIQESFDAQVWNDLQPPVVTESPNTISATYAGPDVRHLFRLKLLLQ